MNNPNKTINVNLSSLLSLKAELLRKQAEVSKTKAQRITTEEYSANRSSSSSNLSKRHKDKKEQDADDVESNETKVSAPEDAELLAKSQRVLQAKSKFYDRMSRSGGKLNSDDNCLVMFNRKQQDAKSINEMPVQPYIESEESSSSSDEDNEADDPDSGADPDDWVEYTDCLGRTRKCLRRDLADSKKRDADLAASMPERLDQSKANWMIDTKGASPPQDDADDATIGPLPPESIYSDGYSLMSKHDEQRANWERKEQENLDKPDVHYQDVFFDEARQHGVGYYGFSTDEEERRRQQRELDEARERTVTEQQRRDAQRAQRENIIAERVRAAKNRQRARLGLPPLTADEENSNNKKEEVESAADRKARKRADKLKRKQEREEAEREEERKQHVRPWDKEKSGSGFSPSTSAASNDEELEWTYKPERLPMSQQEWNEHQREARDPEFAPPPTDAQGYFESQQQKRTNFTSMPPPAVPPHTQQYYAVPPPTMTNSNGFSIYQSTKRDKAFQRRSYEQNNDVDEDRTWHGGAAIPPPSNLDCELPRAKRTKTNVELERSIEAGLKFLRQNSDKNAPATKSAWTAKADY